MNFTQFAKWKFIIASRYGFMILSTLHMRPYRSNSAFFNLKCVFTIANYNTWCYSNKYEKTDDKDFFQMGCKPGHIY